MLTRTIRRSLLQAAMRLYPLNSGVIRICQSKIFRSCTQEPEMVEIVLRTGQKILVDVSDYCGRPIYFWGDYDARITKLCVDILNRGETMLDVGANYGEVALAAASKVGPSGSIHAFEPNPEISRILRRSAELNGFRQLHVHTVALGASDGVGTLMVPTENTGSASLVAHRGGTSVDVKVRNAGHYVRALNLRSLDVLKLDVEGMEGEVLEAIADVLNEFRPRRIIFESHPEPGPFFARHAVKCLVGIGYNLFQLSIERQFSNRPRLRAIRDETDVANGYDFVAMPSEVYSKRNR